MNDFTKEELEKIRYWCQLDPDITKKLQSLIDNYCKHPRKNHADVNWASIHSQSCGNNL